MTATMSARDTRLHQRMDATDARLDQLSQMMEQFFGNFSTNQPENTHFLGIQNPPLQPPPQPPPNQPTQQDPRSQSFPEATSTNSSHLRAEEVGY